MRQGTKAMKVFCRRLRIADMSPHRSPTSSRPSKHHKRVPTSVNQAPRLFEEMTCHGIFPPPSIRVRPNLRTDNEANEIHGRTDHRHPGEHEAGAKCADLCRKHGMSEGTFSNWKAKFGGMTVSEAKRLKALEDENAKLKKLLAEQMLDLAAMKELVLKKW